MRRILLAVDPVRAVIDEAVEWGADLLVTHHPLLLRAVHAVRGDHRQGPGRAPADPGRLRAVRRAHQRRRRRRRGSPTRWPACSGWTTCGRCGRSRPSALDKIVVVRPGGAAERVVDALAAAGAGRARRLRARCAWTSTGTGTFTPAAGRQPDGRRGRRASSRWPRPGSRWCCARHRRAAVVAALRAAHPYEEPAFDVLELADPGRAARHRAGRRPGRAGDAATTFAERVAAALPATAQGVRVGGDPDAPGAAGRGLRRRGRRPVRRRAAPRRRRLRHRRPAPPPGVRGPRDATAAPVPGRRRALGQRVAVAGRLRARCSRPQLGDTGGLRWRPASRTRVTDPWTVDPDVPQPSQEPPLKAAAHRPAAPARRAGPRHPPRPARAPRAHPARARRDSPSSSTGRASCATSSSRAETEPSDIARELTKAEPDVDQVRAARRPRPAAAGRRPGRLAEGAGEPAARDRLAGQAPGRPGGRRPRGHGAAGARAEPRSTELGAERADAAGHAWPSRPRRRDAADAEIDAEAEQLRPQRDRAGPARSRRDLLALYEKIREQQGGVGAAELRQRRCEGCRLELEHAEINELRDGRRRRGRALRGVPPHPGPHGRVGSVSRRASSSRPTAGRGATRARPPTARWCATPRPARCCAERAEYIGMATNNVAEYRGLIAGLRGRPRARPGRDGRGADGLQAGRRADVRPLEDQAPGHAAAGRCEARDGPAAGSGHATPGCRASGTSTPTGWPTRRWTPRPAGRPGRPAAAPAELAHAGRAAATRPEAGRPRPSTAGRLGRRPRDPDHDWCCCGTARPPLTAGEAVQRRRRRRPAASETGGRQAARGGRGAGRARRVDAVVSSPMRRTRQTAEAVAGRLGLPVRESTTACASASSASGRG